MGSGSVSPRIPPGRPRTGMKQVRAERTSPRKRGCRSASKGLSIFSVRQTPPEGSEWALEMRAIKTIELLVPVSSMRCRTYTPGLSTWWSTTALKGELVSRWVSRLDAFSDYPVRTYLRCIAAGATTAPPEVRSSRSSRTRDKSSQNSNTHGR